MTSRSRWLPLQIGMANGIRRDTATFNAWIAADVRLRSVVISPMLAQQTSPAGVGCEQGEMSIKAAQSK